MSRTPGEITASEEVLFIKVSAVECRMMASIGVGHHMQVPQRLLGSPYSYAFVTDREPSPHLFRRRHVCLTLCPRSGAQNTLTNRRGEKGWN